MKYLSKMMINLMQSNDFIDEQDRIEIESELEASFEASKQGRIGQIINKILSHPVVMGVVLFFWVRLSSYIRRERMANEADSMEEAFESAMKEKIMKKMVDKM